MEGRSISLSSQTPKSSHAAAMLARSGFANRTLCAMIERTDLAGLGLEEVPVRPQPWQAKCSARWLIALPSLSV